MVPGFKRDRAEHDAQQQQDDPGVQSRQQSGEDDGKGGENRSAADQTIKLVSIPDGPNDVQHRQTVFGGFEERKGHPDSKIKTVKPKEKEDRRADHNEPEGLPNLDIVEKVHGLLLGLAVGGGLGIDAPF